MVKKIKRKVDSPEVEVLEGEEGAELGQEGGARNFGINFPTEKPDAFEVASIKSAAWIDDNRNLAIGVVVAVVVAAIGVFVAVQFTTSQAEDASASLSLALASFEVLVEGSSELEAIKANPEIKAPTVTFASNDEKWQAIYDQAGATLADHGSGAVASTAQLTQAAAAFNLKKFDESTKLYNEYLAGSPTKDVKPFAYFGLANSLAAQGEFDKAIVQLDKVAEISPDQAIMIQYEKARMLERNGKVEEAKKLYHDILEAEPESTFRSDIERRLATI